MDTAIWRQLVTHVGYPLNVGQFAELVVVTEGEPMFVDADDVLLPLVVNPLPDAEVVLEEA